MRAGLILLVLGAVVVISLGAKVKAGSGTKTHKHKAHKHNEPGMAKHKHKLPKESKKEEKLDVVLVEEAEESESEAKIESKPQEPPISTPQKEETPAAMRLSKKELQSLIASAVQAELSAFKSTFPTGHHEAKEEHLNTNVAGGSPCQKAASQARPPKAPKPPKAKKCLDVEWEGLAEPLIDAETGLPVRESSPLQRCSCSCRSYPTKEENAPATGGAETQKEKTIGETVDELVSKAKEEQSNTASNPDPIDEI